MSGTGEFSGVGYLTDAHLKAKEDKGVVLRTLELKVIVPEPPDEKGKAAFRRTVQDVMGMVGDRGVFTGATEQMKLPMDDRR